MPIVALRYFKDWLAASPTGGLVADAEGNAFLRPQNESPNANWLDINRRGEPKGWGVDMPESETGWYPLVSQGASAPLHSTLTRQTSTDLPLGKDSWTANGPMVLGYMPEYALPSRLPRPAAPIVENIPRAQKGFAAGYYGAAYALRDEFGHRTPVSAMTVSESAVGEGQAITFFVPQGLASSGARYIEIYLTKSGATANAVDPTTLRFQEHIDLYHHTPTEWKLTGPFRMGDKPEEENDTGLTPPKPKIGGKKADIYIAKASFDLVPGNYRFAYQLSNERGTSLLGEFSELITINSQRENKAFYIGGPEHLPEGISWVPWLQVQRDRERVHYRIVRASGRHPDTSFFESPRRSHKERIYIYGVSEEILDEAESLATEDTEDDKKGDRKKKRLARRIRQGPYVIVEEDRPDVDSSIVEDPDTAQGPDPVIGEGQTWPTTGVSYRGAVSKSTSIGAETRPSPSVKSYLRTTPEGGPDTLRITPTPDVNKLANATFSEHSPPRTANLPSGKPADWEITGNTGPAFADFDDGMCILSTGSTHTSNVAVISKLWALPDGDQTNICILGTVRLLSTVVGTARLLLDEFTDDDLVTPASTTVLLSIAHSEGTGIKTLEPYGKIYGPGGTAHPTSGAAYVRLRCQGLMDTGSWNQTIHFWNLAIFPFAAALRKGRRRPNRHTDYEVSAAKAFPEQSEYFVGPPEVPPGGTKRPKEEAYSVLDFESGFTAGAEISDGTTVSSWNFLRATSTNTDSVVESSSVLAGTRNWRIQDDNTGGTSANIYTSRDFTGVASGASLAVRALMKVSKLPTKGEHTVAQIRTTGGNTLAAARLTSTGKLTLRYFLGGSITTSVKNVLGGIATGDVIDFELGVVNEVDGSGVARLSAGKNRPRTSTETFRNIDWSGGVPRVARVGLISETDSSSKAIYRIDNVVVTKTGDILDREGASTPTGIAPTDPDRPLYPTWASGAKVVGQRVKPTTRNGSAYEVTVAGTASATEPNFASAANQGQTVTLDSVTYKNVGSEWRDFDASAEGEEIPQFWWFHKPGGRIGGGWGLYNEEVIEVIPGQTYTHAVMARYNVLEDDPDEEPLLPFQVSLEGEDLPNLDVGSPFDPGATGTSTWGTADRFHTITVPTADSKGRTYTQARIRSLNSHGCVFVCQEHLWALGSLTTQRDRDAARRFATATTGSFTAIFDSYPPEVKQGGMPLGNRWYSLGVVDDTDGLPTGNTITGVTYRSSNTTTFSGSFITDPTLVPETRYVEIKGTLNGNGVASPTIPAGGVYLSMKKIEPTLLRADFSEFSGGTFLTGLEIPPIRPEYNLLAEAGEVYASRISDEKMYLPPFTIHVFSEEALDEIQATPPKGLLAIESAMIGGKGVRMIISPAQVIDFDSVPVTARVLANDDGNLRRYVNATATIERAEVHRMGNHW